MELSNFIKYCLGYVKLTQQRSFISQQKYSLELPKEYFDLEGLLNGDLDGDLGEIVNLDLFYTLDPKDVKEEQEKQYKKEKGIANQVQEIYNKYKNDPFTKQIIFSFGYFEIEIPIDGEENGELLEEEEDNIQAVKTKVDRYPLFSLPITIEKINGRYFIYFVDPEIQVNISILEPILGEDLYYELLDEISTHESEGDLTLPLEKDKIFLDIWHKIKEKLKLKEARFDEKSFKLKESKIAISPRANYFLAEDLQKLSKLKDEELDGTCLGSWIDNTDLNVGSNVPEESELFFPFLYDKYQLNTLSLLKNKASIIEGPPGTGKSETISNILCHLAATGNRVLFVSQKAQALKVVKDKLKKTGVKYLFGYLPNPASAQLGEEDEIDGIAPQLSALQAYIDDTGYARKREGVILDQVVAYKDKAKGAFEHTLEIERKVYKLNQELKDLSPFNVSITDLDCFKSSFNHERYLEIVETKEHIVQLNKLISKYSKDPLKKEFDAKLEDIDFSKDNFSHLVTQIKDDVKRSGYDRHSNLFRKINNAFRNSRLSKIRVQLPREIVDLIDGRLNQDISRRQSVEFLDGLSIYLQFHENADILEQTKQHLQETFKVCGLNDGELSVLVELVDKHNLSNLDTLKEKVLRAIEITHQINSLLESTHDLNKLSQNLKTTQNKQREQVSLYIQNIVNNKILSQWAQGITIKQIVKKLAKAFGKSKKAYKTFDNLRKDPDNFNAIRDLIPIWIMELDDASRIIPLEAGIFDYVILDEASQCNIAYTLPVMFRAKHALFVGDAEQMRDNTVMFKSNRAFDELARINKVPEEMQIKSTGSAVQSVLEIAGLRGFTAAPLRYHYRSPKELIGFSNKNFYKPKGKELVALNNNYLTYKNTNRVLINHLVESDWSDEISDKVNIAEAKAILDLFKELRADEKYKDKSVGILTFFNAQASKLREIFEDAGFKEEVDNFKISIIEGIQGDEKDIILYSFVIRSSDQKNKYIALTGESGDIRSDVNKGRVNVAFSRARLQVHCFYSIPKMPEGIWLKRYLEYVDENGEVDFYSTELQPFDSYFEEEFYAKINDGLKKNYIIQNQVKSCGFKLDFVVTNTSTGKKLAIECDGPCHFEDEIAEEYSINIESDEERQRVLEAAGWNFYRIKYSDWINESFDRDDVVRQIQKLLT